MSRAKPARLEASNWSSHFHSDRSKPRSPGVRSLAAFERPDIDDEDDNNNGAEPPHIPLKHARRPLSGSDLIISPPLKSFRDLHIMDTTGMAKSVQQDATEDPNRKSAVNIPDEERSEPEQEYVHDATASRSSPSTAPRSLMSSSARSRLHSSSISSVGYAPSVLPALQTRGATDHDGLEPLAEEEIDPASFDLVVPAHSLGKQYSLETQSELLFSVKHLAVIFENPLLLQRFTNFIYQSRPASVPILEYYMNTLKALKAINYANAVVDGLSPVQGLEYTDDPITKTFNQILVARATQAFETLVNQDLPAYITHTYIQTVSVTIKRRIADTLPIHLKEMSEGLAEVFCLTDPSRPDNPIVFASEEFHKTTQYGMSYVLGRNCRFLQGPKTNPFSVRRIREKLDEGVEHCETFLNYRRDGSPFMNLLMCAPLYDSRGNVRYHIGAQVDVSGLVKNCAGLESLERLVERENPELLPAAFEPVKVHGGETKEQQEQAQKNEFQELAEMFSLQELKTVRESGGLMHRVQQEEIQDTEVVSNWHRPRLLIRDDATVHRRDSDPVLNTAALPSMNGPKGGRLSGVFEHYLLVRPYPSLRVLFASPSLRVPGMLQSHFLSRLGGSSRLRDAIEQAFADGHGVTAKVRWISGKKGLDTEDNSAAGNGNNAGGPGRGRWIHTTPLLGGNGAVGVWMVVLVDDENEAKMRSKKEAPPVEAHLRPASKQQLGFNPGYNNNNIHHQQHQQGADDMSLKSFLGGDGGSTYNSHTPFSAPSPTVHRRTPAINSMSFPHDRPISPNAVRFDSL
ncbi:hypothetical protein BX600DRAFT_516485 [Xylariales sp. PMI_506]|nr:hypothetical protein BX600DRAFT_516485 [Xylariales sp. PMI_506]